MEGGDWMSTKNGDKMSTQRMPKRRLAHHELDRYINWLADNPGVEATRGTDDWTLLIDQVAHAAAIEEAGMDTL